MEQLARLSIRGVDVQPSATRVVAELEVRGRPQRERGREREALALASVVEVDLVAEVGVEHDLVEEAARTELRVEARAEAAQHLATDTDVVLIELDAREAVPASVRAAADRDAALQHFASRLLVLVVDGEQTDALEEPRLRPDRIAGFEVTLAESNLRYESLVVAEVGSQIFALDEPVDVRGVVRPVEQRGVVREMASVPF